MCHADAWLFFLRAEPAGTGYRSDFFQNESGRRGKPSET